MTTQTTSKPGTIAPSSNPSSSSAMESTPLPQRPLLLRNVPPACHRLSDKGLVAGAAGNISIRDNEAASGWFWTTPSGYRLDAITTNNLVPVPIDGELRSQCASSSLPPTSEWLFHQRLYQTRPDIGAIVHAHPPKATSLAIAGITLNEPFMAEVVFHLGEIPLVPYHLPGSEDLANAVASTMANAKAALLHHHGVITVGTTLQDAINALELLESYAEIYLNTRQLINQGVSIAPLNNKAVAAIKKLRQPTDNLMKS